MASKLEEHFWARPTSSKVGTELTKVGTELSYKTDQISPPPNVKHVLAPLNDFGTQKNTLSIYKSFGNWEDPLPHVVKISQIILYFF